MGTSSIAPVPTNITSTITRQRDCSSRECGGLELGSSGDFHTVPSTVGSLISSAAGYMHLIWKNSFHRSTNFYIWRGEIKFFEKLNTGVKYKFN